MGTHGLLGFIIRGQRHSAHVHHDGYPEGLGKDIVEFILKLTPDDYATMARLVAEITWVDWRSTPSSELEERYLKLGYADPAAITIHGRQWCYLLHEVRGAAALPGIQSGGLKHMLESPLEAGNWQWAYFIDFEHRMLETWGKCDTLLDIVPFEKLVRDGVKKYVRSIYRYYREASGEEEESEEESEEF